MFGPLVIAYLFLGGAGAGLCLVASGVGLLMERRELASGPSPQLVDASSSCRRLLAPVFAVAAGTVALGLFCLLADLGSPEAALGVLTGGATSWANLGVIALAACVAVSMLQLVLLCTTCGAPVTALRVLQALGLAAGFIAAAYTGLLLMDMTGVPFWSTLWLPVLFTLSALGCGLAAFVFCAVASGVWESFGRLFERLALVDIAVVVLEAMALALFLVHGMQSCGEGEVARFLGGDLTPVFWGGVVFAGLLVPFALEVAALLVGDASPYHLSTHVLAASVFALTGAACLRYCVVVAGTHPFLGVLGASGAAIGM